MIKDHTISWTLWRYMGARFLTQLFIIGGALASLIFVFESIELFRRAAGDDVSALRIFIMGLLKLPETMQIIAPFIFLTAALSLFWQLSRSSELVVMRANGISVWRFTTPIISLTLFLGILNFALFQPISAASLSRYEILESQYLGEERRIISLSDKGLWLRERQDNLVWLLHAQTINLNTSTLGNIMVLVMDQNGDLMRRYDAQTGQIDQNRWILNNGLETSSNGSSEAFDRREANAGLNSNDIIAGFTEAETISAWSMPHQIARLKNSGFSTRTLQLYFYNLIAAPFLWISMILIALTVSLNPHRLSRSTALITLGIVVGFFYFLFARYFEALSITQRIPELLAIWTPILIATFIPISILLQKEDG